MKITVGIPSRDRPLELAAAVLSLDKTRSGGHQVEYIVGHDHNDSRTAEVVSQLVSIGLAVRSSFGPRPLGLGEIHNRMIAETDPDAAFLLWSDRLVAVDMHWDHGIAMTVLEFPTRRIWMDSHHLVGPGQPIMTPMWRKALGQENPYPAIFPFWFDDSAAEEIDALLHGFPRVALHHKCAGPRTAKTTRCRDLDFWIDVFAATRPDRVRQARKIGAHMGIFPKENPEVMGYFTQRDADFHARAEALMEQFGAPGLPDETYLMAKEQAERLLVTLKDSQLMASHWPMSA